MATCCSIQGRNGVASWHWKVEAEEVALSIGRGEGVAEWRKRQCLEVVALGRGGMIPGWRVWKLGSYSEECLPPWAWGGNCCRQDDRPEGSMTNYPALFEMF